MGRSARARRLVLPVILGAALLGGCAGPSAFGVAKADSGVYSVTVIRQSENKSIPPLRRVVTNKKAVLALYHDMMAVRRKPEPFTYMCPMDLGVSYELKFDLGGKVTLATADGSGCEFIHLSKTKILWASGKSGQPFWNDLAAILKMTPAQLRG